MMTDVIFLISQEQRPDAYGDLRAEETSRRVFATPGSVGQSEFYQAQAVGLQPQKRFTLQDAADYAGEMIVEHNGTRYRVLRTYQNGQALELTVYREVDPA